jgi:endonuclease/exonuclease/phosphatase family metal-dependent hydrolase
MEIDLVTINTWKCEGDYYKRRQLLAADLQKMGFTDQVIFCQECFRTIDGKVDTIRYLSEALKIPAHFVPARRKYRIFNGAPTDSFSGLGILTNLRAGGGMAVELPSSTADGGRSAQFLTLELPTGGLMLIANVHLTHLRNNEELRIHQVDSVLQEISRSTACFRIVGGDFNAEENSTEIQLFKERGPVIGSASHWVDHLMIIRPDVSPYPKFACSETVLDRPDEESGLRPSDHFGVHARLVVPDQVSPVF